MVLTEKAPDSYTTRCHWEGEQLVITVADKQLGYAEPCTDHLGDFCGWTAWANRPPKRIDLPPSFAEHSLGRDPDVPNMGASAWREECDTLEQAIRFVCDHGTPL